MFQATGAARNWLKPCSYGELALRGRRSRGDRTEMTWRESGIWQAVRRAELGSGLAPAFLVVREVILWLRWPTTAQRNGRGPEGKPLPSLI